MKKTPQGVLTKRPGQRSRIKMETTEFKSVKSLTNHLKKNYTLVEIQEAYKEFNPEFFNGDYQIPSSHQEWGEQIYEDLKPRITYEGEKIAGHNLSDIL